MEFIINEHESIQNNDLLIILMIIVLAINLHLLSLIVIHLLLPNYSIILFFYFDFYFITIKFLAYLSHLFSYHFLI